MQIWWFWIRSTYFFQWKIYCKWYITYTLIEKVTKPNYILVVVWNVKLDMKYHFKIFCKAVFKILYLVFVSDYLVQNALNATEWSVQQIGCEKPESRYCHISYLTLRGHSNHTWHFFGTFLTPPPPCDIFLFPITDF